MPGMPRPRPRCSRADVAISLDPDALENLDRNPASILLLQPDLGRLAVLDEVTRVHDRRIRVAQGSALIPNFFCVAGAFFLGFTSLTTVMITNLGTYSTYARTAGRDPGPRTPACEVLAFSQGTDHKRLIESNPTHSGRTF